MLIVSEEYPENFGPLTQTRATFELRYGALCPLDRALLITSEVALRARPELEDYLRAKTGLPVNEDIEGEPFPGLPAHTPWEILARSDAYIAADFHEWDKRHLNFRDSILGQSGAHLIGDKRDVFIGRGAVVQPGCVLDASGGPIILAERVQVKWSQIQGPVFVGAGSVVDGAKLRAGTSLGPNCKVGGEIAASIFQSRVNKAHEGFVGHTWAGRWVNFGALATTSNLKNTYGTIRFQRDSVHSIETGSQFLGSLIGDHTKIGIGQLLTTGANIGAGCNIFGGGVCPKYIPSFNWGGLAGWNEHRLEDCLKTVRATLGRRNAVLRPESEALLRTVFEQTKSERAQFLTSQA
jgi:UDP-N-acetylglucosamine diphosphorylase/glucosamine-1-phosphate N-acetyltransferase